MYYLYLDESGDLGHYRESPGASKHFVITVLEVTNGQDKKAIEKAVERTLKNKLHKRRSSKTSLITEIPRLPSNSTFTGKLRKFLFVSMP